MKTAKEMRATVRKVHPLNKYFEQHYASKIEESASRGETSLSVEIDSIPSRLSRPEMCSILIDYISSFGYSVSATSNNKRIDIHW